MSFLPAHSIVLLVVVVSEAPAASRCCVVIVAALEGFELDFNICKHFHCNDDGLLAIVTVVSK